jgi:predicted nucleic acid-binding protein
MRVFDASSMIYAWDNYPVQQFPGLWKWMAGQIGAGELAMPSVALEEVAHKAPECAEWLKACDIEVLEINNAILQDAMRIKNLLGIVGDKYGGGVGENDLLIIATASAHHGPNWSRTKSGNPRYRRNWRTARSLPSAACRPLLFVGSSSLITSSSPAPFSGSRPFLIGF